MISAVLPTCTASVVVISYNARDFLACSLAALNHQQLLSGDSFEVIVVDDGSNDGTSEMVEGKSWSNRLRLVRLPRDGRSSRGRARNAGARAASGKVLIFLDGDQLPAPAFVADHIALHRCGSDLAVMGLRTRLAGPVHADLLRDGFDLSLLPQRQAGDGRLAVVGQYSENMGDMAVAWHLFYSCNVSLRTDSFRSIGGFDEDFTGWDLRTESWVTG